MLIGFVCIHPWAGGEVVNRFFVGTGHIGIFGIATNDAQKLSLFEPDQERHHCFTRSFWSTVYVYWLSAELLCRPQSALA